MDKDRILSKIDEINKYLEELGEIELTDFEEYKNSVQKKRACERLLQISIEAIIDVCNILISDLKLGLPSEEEELFDKLEKRKVISKEMRNVLYGMKSMRNILVNKYGVVKDEIIFETLSENLNDFDKFKEEILKFLKR